jgi:hypothetical protein
MVVWVTGLPHAWFLNDVERERRFFEAMVSKLQSKNRVGGRRPIKLDISYADQ